jgi:hypothetical protein
MGSRVVKRMVQLNTTLRNRLTERRGALTEMWTYGFNVSPRSEQRLLLATF